MTHPDQDIIDFLTKDLDLRAAPDWMIERARAFRGGGWLPIETAPKTGERIILAWGNASRVGFWLDNSGSERPWAGWRVPSMEAMPSVSQPDFWRPLPNPPKDTE